MLSHLEQNKVVRVYPLEDAEFLNVASIFHSFFFFFFFPCHALQISFPFNKKSDHTPSLGSRQSLNLPFFSALHISYNNQCNFFSKPSLQQHPTPSPLSSSPLTGHSSSGRRWWSFHFWWGDGVKFSMVWWWRFVESFVCLLQWGQKRCLSVPLVRATPILWHFSKFPEKEKSHTVLRFSWYGHRESSVLLDSITWIILYAFFIYSLVYFFILDFVS